MLWLWVKVSERAFAFREHIVKAFSCQPKDQYNNNPVLIIFIYSIIYYCNHTNDSTYIQRDSEQIAAAVVYLHKLYYYYYCSY